MILATNLKSYKTKMYFSKIINDIIKNHVKNKILIFLFQRIDLNMIITTPCNLGLSGSTNDTFDKYVLPTIIISSRYIHLPSCVVKSMSLYQKLYYYFYLKKKKNTLATAIEEDWKHKILFFFSSLVSGRDKAQDSYSIYWDIYSITNSLRSWPFIINDNESISVNLLKIK